MSNKADYIFRGDGWYIILDNKFTLGYSEGILSDDIKNVYIECFTDKHTIIGITITIGLMRVSIRTTPKSEAKMYVYPLDSLIRIHLPDTHFMKFYKVLSKCEPNTTHYIDCV